MVKVEGPVHEDRVIDAVRRIYGSGRAGRQIREIISTAIEKERQAGTIDRQTDEQNRNLGVFLDTPGRERHTPPRAAGIDVRPIDHIWPGEIELGLLCVVESSFGIERSEACVAAARAFGFARVGPHIRNALEAAIDRLVSEGFVQDTGAGLILGSDD
ncbi:MAG TPA: hypothetical protein DIU15_07605 [Deltaproteobacteria bacterium]|nr:hypothetical protein [Deltaproteobacteria bacterium]|tara:strand:- start:117 stop:590 length:474 start_codon:yes stop_codon:yes gene_type:complete